MWSWLTRHPANIEITRSSGGSSHHTKSFFEKNSNPFFSLEVETPRALGSVSCCNSRSFNACIQLSHSTHLHEDCDPFLSCHISHIQYLIHQQTRTFAIHQGNPLTLVTKSFGCVISHSSRPLLSMYISRSCPHSALRFDFFFPFFKIELTG